MVDNQKLNQIEPGTSTAVRSAVRLEDEKKNEDINILKEFKDKCVAVKQCLKEDMYGADAKWNLFIAACQSYRHDSCLKPFPPMFVNSNNIKDIDLLLKAVDCVPAFPLLEKILSSSDDIKLNVEAINLLHWVLVSSPDSSLKTVPKEKFDEILNLVPCELSVQPPDFIFQLKHSEKSPAGLKWKTYKANYKSLYAFHGSRLENFHSIIHYGLQLSLTKTPLFGQGIYVSSELLVSLPYSLTGFGWGKSVMGAELSVVALCEVLDHPGTHCQTNDVKDKNRALPSDSIAGEVPHKYYLVTNSELIRIRYLLVYARSRPPAINFSESSVPRSTSSVLNWIKEHKLLTCIVGYVVLLASVGLSNNQSVMRYYRMLLNKAGIQ